MARLGDPSGVWPRLLWKTLAEDVDGIGDGGRVTVGRGGRRRPEGVVEEGEEGTGEGRALPRRRGKAPLPEAPSTGVEGCVGVLSRSSESESLSWSFEGDSAGAVLVLVGKNMTCRDN